MNAPSEKHERILRVLRDADGPMSANEVWETLRADRNTVGIATVYRALKRGVEEGALSPVELQAGSVRYEPADLEHHHHFLCSICERAFDLEGCVRDLRGLLPQGFEMTGHEVLLYGTCSTCRRTS